MNNLIGQRFGKLTVIKLEKEVKTKYWLCICDCGKEKVMREYQLLVQGLKSCGCLQKSVGFYANYKHGFASNKGCLKEYNVWASMKRRCDNPKEKAFKYYGAKGIKYCDRWKDFINFIEDMDLAPSDKHTLDRIDGTKGYYKENCRWATRKEQASNTKSNRWIEYDNQRYTLSEWARRLNTSPSYLHELLGSYTMDQIKNKTYLKYKRNGK